MNDNDEPFPRLDRTAFSVTDFAGAAQQDREYWWSRTPEERLRHMELLRRMNYGDSTERLPRVLELVELTWRRTQDNEASGRLKDRADLEELP